jgi:hypothetical protein
MGPSGEASARSGVWLGSIAHGQKIKEALQQDRQSEAGGCS